MIRMNSDFYHSLTKDSYNEARDHILTLWTGPVPTEEEIKAVINTGPRTGYYVNDLIANMEGKGNVCQGYIKYSTSFRPTQSNEGIVHELASRPEEFLVLNEDAVGYMILFVADGSGIGIEPFSGVSAILITGSVGDIGSGKDLEIPTGALSSATTYKADDFVFNFV